MLLELGLKKKHICVKTLPLASVKRSIISDLPNRRELIERLQVLSNRDRIAKHVSCHMDDPTIR